MSEPVTLVCIPHFGFMAAELTALMLGYSLAHRIDILAPSHLAPCAYARNFCVDKFMEKRTDCTHLWFIDADTAPPPDALTKLMEADKPIISGIVPAWKVLTEDATEHHAIPTTVVLTNDGYQHCLGEGVSRIDASGFACMLIKREVFEKIPFPWFEERPWGHVRGEDYRFCQKLQDAGIPLYAHFDVECRHRKVLDMTVAESLRPNRGNG